MKISIEEWYDLKNIVLEAVHSKKLAPESLKYNESQVVSLVKSYLKTGSENDIDEAARLTASYRTDLDTDVTAKQYWLLLAKS